MAGISRQTIAARVEEIANQLGEAHGLEIVEVELKGSGRNQLLRISIDRRPGDHTAGDQAAGVTHGDCETMSRLLERELDQSDLFPEQYTLEVSSPGVERKLKKPADFERFRGQKARLVIKEGGKSRFLEGTLAESDAENVTLEVAGTGPVTIPFSSLERANLKFEW